MGMPVVSIYNTVLQLYASLLHVFLPLPQLAGGGGPGRLHDTPT